ncbi:MAG TPA: hypothetical protein VNQ76_16895 [Planctomicrobium sp.]|nr:hypothetical protein [Planctomicrobium sp.]
MFPATITRFPCRGFWLFLAMTAAVTSGCSNKTPDGPARYALSGNVTFDGKPVPTGTIRFSPDREKGNQGPGTIADIRHGKYQTLPGKGIVGGPMVVEISGSDGIPVEVSGETIPSGTALIESYRTEINLPKETATRDFDIRKER